jgi:hypothetical protein
VLHPTQLHVGPDARSPGDDVVGVAFDSGSRLVVALGDDRQVKCWNTENGLSRESFNLQVPGLSGPHTLAVRERDHQLALGCGDRVLFFPLPRFK